jgi:hypothetical protein
MRGRDGPAFRTRYRAASHSIGSLVGTAKADVSRQDLEYVEEGRATEEVDSCNMTHLH